MNPVEVIEVSREAIYITLKIGAPIILIALGVGLLIALFQALTQMQEMTLSFVPKIVAVCLGIVVFMPFMLGTMMNFTKTLMDRIVSLG
ncbi:flagellar biosynthesis protein FliQ [Pelagibius sp. Alg239-R121]|uniref:flagellar biosynthesis protein FliQ n=1 Tax=Pelagibius sp. Alg239-R121 TaxID=2993448 RepID=UPI0024A71267|nr:flagellar biosynthesis protein FliQ [Pelagibius sp. Alg239-R121]